jgi:hypothetical protein
MILWIDAQMAPSIATWICNAFASTAIPVRDIGLRDATDREIFLAARRSDAIVMTKDSDFVRLLRGLWGATKGHLDYLWQYLQCLPPTTAAEQIASSTGTAAGW